MNSEKNPPAFTVWFAPEKEGAYWTVIGSLWANKTTGYSMKLGFVPLGEGRIVVLPFIIKW